MRLKEKGDETFISKQVNHKGTSNPKIKTSLYAEVTQKKTMMRWMNVHADATHGT